MVRIVVGQHQSVEYADVERRWRLLWRRRGGRHLGWIALHSVSLWLVLSVPPIAAAFLALGIDLGSSERMLEAAWTTQAAIGVAVAVPSAPGFFGVFHFACRLALVRFGVSPDAAVAAGTLIHAVMWVTLTAAGFLVTLRGHVGDDHHDVEGIDVDEWRRMGLNERQITALLHLAEHRRITNRDLQEVAGDVSPETIRRDLADLVERGLLLKVGEKRGAYYILK